MNRRSAFIDRRRRRVIEYWRISSFAWPSSLVASGLFARMRSKTSSGTLKSTSPSVGSISRKRSRPNVVLPHPLVGESGCGKTTLGRLLLRLIEPTEGDVLFNVPEDVFERMRANGPAATQDDGQTKELIRQYSITRRRRRSMKALRRFMQPVFQDPFTSLDPRMLVKDIVAEPLLVSGLATRPEAYEQGARLLQEVGLRPEHLYRFPHEFSGGQRQRIAIARALAPEPEFLNLLKDIQRKQNLTYLLITHNLSVVRHMADRVAVMYLGRILERTRTAELFANPMHPYTKALLSAVPLPDPKRRRERIILPGDVPSPIAPPAGCRFHTRCNAVLPHCGWSSRDVAATVAYLFDPSRNPEASDLPPLEEVTIRGEEVLLLRYREPATESHRLRVEALVRARSSRPDGVAFRAIARVGLDAGRVVLEFLPPLEPELLEIVPHHFVACYLYPGTQPVAT